MEVKMIKVVKMVKMIKLKVKRVQNISISISIRNRISISKKDKI